MKQSSIEWIVENLTMVYPRIEEMRLLVDKAKAMHKEEIENAYISNSMIRTRSKAEQYYNETFNTKECYHKGKYTYNKETFECHKCGLIVPNEYRFNTKEK